MTNNDIIETIAWIELRNPKKNLKKIYVKDLVVDGDLVQAFVSYVDEHNVTETQGEQYFLPLLEATNNARKEGN